MKRIHFAVLVCLLMGNYSQAQNMKTLTSIGLGITVSDDYSKSLGLTPEAVGNDLLVGVKRDMPRLNIVSGSPTKVAMLGIKIMCSEAEKGLAACFLEMELSRPADIVSDDGEKLGIRLAVGVWRKELLTTGGSLTIGPHIHQKISELVTEFAAEYYKQNLNS